MFLHFENFVISNVLRGTPHIYRKLEKRMKIYRHITVMDLNLEREHFTRHGLHMNYKGKQEATRNISATVEDMFNKKKICPIDLQWKDCIQEPEENICLQVTSHDYEITTRSRAVKTPAHLQDFLCENQSRRLRPRNLTG